MFALQPDEIEFIHNVRALSQIQSQLLKTMAATLSHDVTPIIVVAPTDKVRILFPQHAPDTPAYPGNGTTQPG